MKTAVAYIRVSTELQAESGLSLEAQEASIRDWCEKNQISITEIFTDAGISGATTIQERPGLSSALTEVEMSGADILVVAKLDRVSRAPLTLLTLENWLEKRGAHIASVAGEGTESADPSAVLLRRVLQAVAEHELSMISSRTKAALAQKKVRGEKIGRPPYGFKISEDGKLIPNPATFNQVVELVNLRAKTIKKKSGTGRKKKHTLAALTEMMKNNHPDAAWNFNRVVSIDKRWNRQSLQLFIDEM